MAYFSAYTAVAGGVAVGRYLCKINSNRIRGDRCNESLICFEGQFLLLIVVESDIVAISIHNVCFL